MAYYGIYSAGVAQTASDLADTVKFSFRSAQALTANTVLGLDGSDIIYVGTQGQTTTASASFQAHTGHTGVAGLLTSKLVLAQFLLLCTAVVAMS